MSIALKSIIWTLACLITVGDSFAAPKEVPDFAMMDTRGRYYQLRRNDAKVVVLFFTANGCPVARQSVSRLKQIQEDFAEQGARVWMVNSNTGDDRNSIRKEAEEFHFGSLPVLMDETQGVAAMLGVRVGMAVVAEIYALVVVRDENADHAEKAEHADSV